MCFHQLVIYRLFVVLLFNNHPDTFELFGIDCFARSRFSGHYSVEYVATARHSPDVFLCMIAERPAQLDQTLHQRIVADECV